MYHTDIHPVKTTKGKMKSIFFFFSKFWPSQDQERAQLVMWLLGKHGDLNSDPQHLCETGRAACN